MLLHTTCASNLKGLTLLLAPAKSDLLYRRFPQYDAPPPSGINSKRHKGFPMNTSELIEKIAADNSLTKTAAKAVVDGVLKAIADAAVAGEEVNFPGFGKFKVKESPAREGRNPSTGATVQIAASKKVSFQPAKALKDRING